MFVHVDYVAARVSPRSMQVDMVNLSVLIDVFAYLLIIESQANFAHHLFCVARVLKSYETESF